MKLTNIHRVLQFNRSQWLAKYINFNTEKRYDVKNDFEKAHFKLMNNAVFGKNTRTFEKENKWMVTFPVQLLTRFTFLNFFGLLECLVMWLI